MEFQNIKLQGSIFTPELSIANSLPILNLISQSLPKELNENPMVLPIPQDAPANIPRIQFSSDDKKWRVGMSLERTDLVFHDLSLENDEKCSEKSFAEILANFFTQLKDGLDLSVQRLAFVTQRGALIDDPASLIINKFCRPEYGKKGNAFSSAKKFEIHSYKNYTWNTFHLNSWVRVKAMSLKLTSPTPILSIENDLNTLSSGEDPDKRFSSTEIETFIKGVPEHLEGIIQKYFSEVD